MKSYLTPFVAAALCVAGVGLFASAEPGAPITRAKQADLKQVTVAPRGAPSIEIVQSHMQGYWGPFLTGGTKHTYDFQPIKFYAPVKKVLPLVNGKEVEVDAFPVGVMCMITQTPNSGPSVDVIKAATVYFYKNGNTWNFRT